MRWIGRPESFPDTILFDIWIAHHIRKYTHPFMTQTCKDATLFYAETSKRKKKITNKSKKKKSPNASNQLHQLPPLLPTQLREHYYYYYYCHHYCHHFYSPLPIRHLSHDSARTTGHDRSGGDHYPSRDNHVREDLNVVLDNTERVEDSIGADVHKDNDTM